MNKWHLRFLRLAYFGLAAILPVYALADYNATQGAGTIFRAFDGTHGGSALCAAANTQCQAIGLVNSAGAEIGTAGAPVRVDPTGTTPQPITGTLTAVTTITNPVTVTGTVTANAGTNLNTSTLATSALQGTNTATTAHTCSTGGFSELGCLGKIDDDILGPIPAGTAHIGTVGTAPYADGAIPLTASATNTTAAATATLAASAGGLKTYICGFSIRANATAASTNPATVTGVVTATMTFTQWTAPLASGLGVVEMVFTPCIPSSATNTAIAVVSAAPGAGGTVSVSAWGYQL